MQGILDGVDKVLGPIVDLANKLIADVMKHLPSFDLPGKNFICLSSPITTTKVKCNLKPIRVFLYNLFYNIIGFVQTKFKNI